MKKKNLFIGLLTLACTFTSGLGLVSCGGNDTGSTNSGNNNTQPTQIEQVYAQYVIYAEAQGQEPLSYEEWLATIKGADGKDGENGQNGQSAYEIWLANGYSGTQADFLAWLKGENGKDGENGQKGQNGVGISKVETDSDGNLVIYYTDDTKQTVELPKDPAHVHTFGAWTLYGTVEAPCEQSVWFRICDECSDIEWKQGEHTYDENGKCTVCVQYAYAQDVAMVNKMNFVLMVAGLQGPLNPEETFAALEANGIDAEDYKPLYKDRYFFWDSVKNVIVYTDANYNVLYPANATDSKQANWCTLSGEIGEELDEDEVKDLVADNVATVGNANELVSLTKAINDKKVTGVTEIKLPAEVNLMGAEIELNAVSSSLTIGAASGTTKLTGLVESEAVKIAQTPKNREATRNYNAGMIPVVSGKNTVVEFKNITIENAYIGDKSSSLVGALVGSVNGGATVKMTNVTVKNTTVVGLQKVGGLVGFVQGGSKVEISDCTMEKVTVQATQGMAGGIFGVINKSNSYVKVDDAAALVADVKVELVKVSTGNYLQHEGAWYSIDMNNDLTPCLEKYATTGAKDLTNGTCYRYFATCAKYGFVFGEGTHKYIEGLTGYQGKGVVFAYNAQVAEAAASGETTFKAVA